MPREVTVVAIEAEGVEIFGEELSPVMAAAERVLELVREELGAA